jgi:predicted metal-dependent peptidase
MPELVFPWAHEIMHCALNHHTRHGKRDPKLWNMATDYVINLILVDPKIGAMPEGGLLEGLYRGMSAEKVYGVLSARVREGHPLGAVV